MIRRATVLEMKLAPACVLGLALGSACGTAEAPAGGRQGEGGATVAQGGSSERGSSRAGDTKLEAEGGAVPLASMEAARPPPMDEPSPMNEAGAAGSVATTAPSCESMPASCKGESCCTSSLARGCTACAFPSGHTSTVADFALDKYEVTVGRFRKFVEAYQGPPAEGAGAHPWISESGWKKAWDAKMPANNRSIVGASWNWTSTPGANEQQPVSGVSWYAAFAFCAWDGGFLPTELEWQYAAAGGAENRLYPWPGSKLDHDHAVYSDCPGGLGCSSPVDIENVGSKPAGVGKWGQYDLVGSMLEWTIGALTKPFPLKDPCDNCAVGEPGPYAIVRGGAWAWDGGYATNEFRAQEDPEFRLAYVGFRCARNP
jgi:formylglycine-generating enzyme required for sulfatase activity